MSANETPAVLRAVMESMGPQHEWMLDPPVNTREQIKAAVLARRKGMAWAEGEHAGWVLHCALCRAAGVHPQAQGLANAFADSLGISRQNYYRLIRNGETVACVNAAARARLVLVIRPPEDPAGKLRWIATDMPIELTP